MASRRHPQHVAALPGSGPGSRSLARAHGGGIEQAPAPGAVRPRTARDLAAPAPQRGRAPSRTGRRRPSSRPRAGGRDPGGGPARARPPRRPPPHAVGGPGGAGARPAPWPCARAWCARSPTTSTSIRRCWPPAPTSPSCSAASRAAWTRVGGAPSSATRCAASSAARWRPPSTGGATSCSRSAHTARCRWPPSA